MKKKILLIIICILLLNTGCQKEEEYQQIEINEKKLITCLTNELGAYITSEISVDEEVSLNTYTTKKDKIDFYKSIKTDNNNIYAIVKSDEDEIIQDFNFYFSNNFKEYQTYSIHDYNIFIHNNKVDVNFSDLNKCYQTTNNDDIEIKDFNKELAEKLDNTNKVIVKSGDYELGILQNKDIINELLTAIKESKIYGENFLTDAPTIQLEMYNNTDVIEIINLYNDGYRLVPSNKGGYYTTNTDIRKILEKEIEYRFYTLYHLSDECDNTSKLIYEDDNYKYYYNCSEYGEVQVNLLTTNKLIDLKYALENNYINVEQLLIYDNLIIKKEK